MPSQIHASFFQMLRFCPAWLFLCNSLKINGLAIFFSLFSCGLFAQKPVVDSLFHLLETRPARDTNRINRLNDLAWELKILEPERAKKLLSESISLAQSLRFQKGEAAAWNALGLVAALRENWAEADSFYHKALKIRELTGDKKGQASIFNNLGNMAEERGDYPAALGFLQKSLRTVEEMGDSVRMARARFNIATVHESMGNYPEATEAVYSYLAMVEKMGDRDGEARAFSMLGSIQFELEDFKRADDFYRKALTIRELEGDDEALSGAYNNLASCLDELKNYKAADSLYQKALAIRLKNDDQAGIAEIYSNLGDLRKHENRLDAALLFFNKSLKINRSLGDKTGEMLCFNGLGDVLRRQKKFRQALVFTEKYQALANETADEKYKQKALKDLAETWAGLGNFEKAFELRKAYDELRWQRLSETRAKDFERRDIIYGDQKKQADLDRQVAANRLQNAELEKAGLRQKALIGGAAALILLSVLLFNRNRIRKKSNEKLAEQNEVIQKERERSDALLLNILPEKIADELRKTGTAQPRRFDEVTVMFTDFKSFTTVAEQLSPEELVATLDAYFRAFDDIISRHGIEKIKTIGDACMAAAGLPNADPRHAQNMVAAALEIRDFVRGFNKIQIENGFSIFEIRIGIHTGPVVAGIVGSKKFAWDIWGDAVNLAARMESSGEPGRVNISGATFLLVQNEFECEPRGRISAKNKGDVEMFFVENRAVAA